LSELEERGIELPPSLEHALGLAQELQVHQAELEIQNQELAEANQRAESAQRHYQELFEQAPVGYLVLDAQGRVQEANQMAAGQLGLRRARLPGLRLAGLLSTDKGQGLPWLGHRALHTGESQFCEGRPLDRRERGRVFMLQISPRQTAPGSEPGLLVAILETTELRRAEERAQRLAKERGILLQEINHRVGNNLQMLSSLASLEQRRSAHGDPSQAWEGFRQRLRAMARVHRTLHVQGDLSRVDAGAYLSGLVSSLREMMPDATVQLSCSLEPPLPHLSPEQAVLLGIVVCELVTNCHRHAFAPEQEGRVRVSAVGRASGGWEVSVADDGAGFDPGRAATGPGLGLPLVQSLARDHLGAEIHWTSSASGTCCALVLDQEG
jgi:PAS domain S-box-containing protein